MTVISVQCPKCGSPIPSPRVGSTTSCPSCGSTLSIGVGSSGHPLAELVTIGRDTGFLARQQAAERLKGQREKLFAERASAEAKLRTLPSGYVETSPVRIPWRWIGALVLAGVAAGALTSNPLFLIIPCLIGFVVLVVSSDRQMRGMTEEPESDMVAAARSELGQRLAEINSEIDSCSADLARVEADLDRMAREF